MAGRMEWNKCAHEKANRPENRRREPAKKASKGRAEWGQAKKNILMVY